MWSCQASASIIDTLCVGHEEFMWWAGCPRASGIPEPSHPGSREPLLYFQEFCHLLKRIDCERMVSDTILELRYGGLFSHEKE